MRVLHNWPGTPPSNKRLFNGLLIWAINYGQIPPSRSNGVRVKKPRPRPRPRPVTYVRADWPSSVNSIRFHSDPQSAIPSSRHTICFGWELGLRCKRLELDRLWSVSHSVSSSSCCSLIERTRLAFFHYIAVFKWHSSYMLGPIRRRLLTASPFRVFVHKLYLNISNLQVATP